MKIGELGHGDEEGNVLMSEFEQVLAASVTSLDVVDTHRVETGNIQTAIYEDDGQMRPNRIQTAHIVGRRHHDQAIDVAGQHGTDSRELPRRLLVAVDEKDLEIVPSGHFLEMTNQLREKRIGKIGN